jgi:carbonic anhydrase/acetyltransferase-like protein (isoleucine patch superfamily)
VPVYALGDVVPQIDPSAFVHPEAVVIGNVRIGPGSSIWPGAVLRADYGHIIIGARSSVQDNCALHCTIEHPTFVGDDCVIGHLVHLEGCTIESGSLVGTGSIVLHRAVVQSGALVGAGAVVPNDMVVPTGAMALGVPAKLRLDAVDPARVAFSAANYVENGQRYAKQLRRVSP